MCTCCRRTRSLCVWRNIRPIETRTCASLWIPSQTMCLSSARVANGAWAWETKFWSIVSARTSWQHFVRFCFHDLHNCLAPMIKSKVIVVLGAQWGDEGKGKVVDMLANNVDLVCRCQVSQNPTNKQQQILFTSIFTSFSFYFGLF